MKIGILTFHCTNNYGASLQAYALFKFLQLRGYDVQVINYQNKKMENDLEKAYAFPKGLLKIIKYLIFDYTSVQRRKKGFERFKNMLVLSSTKFSNTDMLCKICNNYDFLFVGSDQVWNNYITGDDFSYFFNFKTSAKKISYAASFGVDSLADKYKNQISSALNDFSNISVREIQGIKIIQDLCGIESHLVCDPTFLLNKKDWMLFITKSYAKKRYLLVYCFGLSDSLIKHANQIAKEKGLIILQIDGSRSMSLKYGWKCLRGLSPSEWVNAFYYADYILTNSFHGTAFSIIFEKNFSVELLPPPAKVNSRLTNILNICNLENRLITNDNINTTEINYGYVNERIDSLKSKSYEFVLKACENESR